MKIIFRTVLIVAFAAMTMPHEVNAQQDWQDWSLSERVKIDVGFFYPDLDTKSQHRS